MHTGYYCKANGEGLGAGDRMGVCRLRHRGSGLTFCRMNLYGWGVGLRGLEIRLFRMNLYKWSRRLQ